MPLSSSIQHHPTIQPKAVGRDPRPTPRARPKERRGLGLVRLLIAFSGIVQLKVDVATGRLSPTRARQSWSERNETKRNTERSLRRRGSGTRRDSSSLHGFCIGAPAHPSCLRRGIHLFDNGYFEPIPIHHLLTIPSVPLVNDAGQANPRPRPFPEPGWGSAAENAP